MIVEMVEIANQRYPVFWLISLSSLGLIDVLGSKEMGTNLDVLISNDLGAQSGPGFDKASHLI